ncbi:MAG TPA: branched-chain amino acid ABC transporter ATP-binding protein/permease [Actinophytocola sp.]|uniref:branched-chain amino acid ABC transporter ATP-binding protein/permease n=1 Tax=Actinophytocola sp. TaxID=1872138 RepID=UPI002DBC295C|nr:branched-chain amino acid ABC transporter ATP-binding protein/permease [Actinophytocola sp.]HEU5470433.1 branched-chain amino acid ABC transporter ATP-binding protein/permease [Actinophytocola sp.]
MIVRGLAGIALAVGALAVLSLYRETLGVPVSVLALLTTMLFWVTQATSWNILSGYSGYFSFGQAAYVGVGAYTTAVLFGRHRLDFGLTVLIAAGLCAVLALGIGVLAFRLRSLRGEIFALLTLAVPFILAALARINGSIDGGQGIIVAVPDFPASIGLFQDFLYLVNLLVAGAAVAVAFLMARTRSGWALATIRDAEDVGEALGVATFRYKLTALVASAVIGGVGGSIFALQIGFVTVDSVFTLTVPLFVIVMSVLGGRTHWIGPVLGAVLVVLLQDRLTAADLLGWQPVILGGVLIAMVLAAPEGLYPRVRALLPASRRARPVDPSELDIRMSPVDGAETALVECDELTKNFGGVRAVAGLSLRIRAGELVGLIGPNGSGKTTLVSLLAGSVRPTGGTVRIAGRDTTGLPPHRIAHLGVARTYQIPRPFASMTVRDNVAMAIMFGREPERSLTRARRVATGHLAMVGLEKLAHAAPAALNLHQRQLLEIARALATAPAVLLLDEALAGLNPAEIDNAVEVIRRIHASGVAIVIVEHLLRVVRAVATRVVVLDRGSVLADGDPATVLADPAVVRAYLGKRSHA